MYYWFLLTCVLYLQMAACILSQSFIKVQDKGINGSGHVITEQMCKCASLWAWPHYCTA